MRNRIVAALALAMALAIPTAWAQGPGEPGEGFDPPMGKHFRGGGHDEFRMARMMRLLDDTTFRQRIGLTNEQVEKLRTQGFTAAKAMVRSRADQEIKRIELTELLQAEKPDRPAIDKKLRELADLHYSALKARTDNMLAMRELLTAEQREKMRTFGRERMREFREPRGEQRMGRPRGPHGPGAPPSPPPPPKEMPKD